MHVNTNTVLRALRKLRDEGLLEMRQGRGSRVTGTAAQSAVEERARDLVAFARSWGYRRDELIAVIEGIV
jgi:GntR family transcriptional regulator